MGVKMRINIHNFEMNIQALARGLYKIYAAESEEQSQRALEATSKLLYSFEPSMSERDFEIAKLLASQKAGLDDEGNRHNRFTDWD